MIKKEGSFVAFSRQEELDTVCVMWAVSLSCRRQSLSKSRQTFRQSLFTTFNLCQSVVPPSICLPQIAIPPIFFSSYIQHIKMTTKDCGIVELGIGPSNAIGREGKLRLRSNISSSFAPPSPSKLHPWPISLSQPGNHMQYHSLNFHSKPPPLCRLLQNRTHVKM